MESIFQRWVSFVYAAVWSRFRLDISLFFASEGSVEVIQRFSPKRQFWNFLAARAGLAGCGPDIKLLINTKTIHTLLWMISSISLAISVNRLPATSRPPANICFGLIGVVQCGHNFFRNICWLAARVIIFFFLLCYTTLRSNVMVL